MGSSTYSSATYSTRATSLKDAGISAFNYTDSGAGRAHGTHATLDPVRSGKLDGLGAVRESRDSKEHPASVPIAVWFDVTGSMGDVPRHLQEKMLVLLGLLLRKGYVTDPQIMFCGVGDASWDRAPVQVSQFESGNEMDEHLGNLYLEGGGGGGRQESYELAMYFMARRVVTDAWEKRQHRGYFFIIGDEMAYPRVDRDQVKRFIGEGDDHLQADIQLEEMATELLEKWDTYYILPGGASHRGDREILEFWRKLLGQNVIELDDLDAAPETIALLVGLGEGTVDSVDDGLADLADVGSDRSAITSAGKALATMGSVSAGGTVATTPPPGDLDTPSGNVRL